MPEQKNGEARAWTRRDADLFEDDETECAECGEPIQIGQVMQERPAFSLRFYHVKPEECGKGV